VKPRSELTEKTETEVVSARVRIKSPHLILITVRGSYRERATFTVLTSGLDWVYNIYPLHGEL
jgi:hypothetical protein